MKVLHLGKFYYPYMGGIENHIQNLCQGLKERIQVEVLVANSTSATVTEEVDGIRVTRVGQRGEVASTPLCPGMRGWLAKARYDILHVHLPNPMAAMACLSLRMDAPLIVTYHSDIVRQKMLLRLYSPFRDRFLQRAHTIIATSPNYMAASSVLQGHRDRCVAIPYGIEPRLADRVRPNRVAEIRARFGGPLLLACGRLVYYKGFEYIIEAMKGIDARLIIIGEGPLRGKLERLVKESDLGSKVTLLGGVMNDDTIDYYAACDLFVLPSVTRSEAFAIVQLEAMALGKPVINTWLMDSGVPFVSQDGVTGITVPPRDPAALRDAVQRLLGDEELRRVLGEQGKKRFQEEFCRDTMVDRVMEVYRSTQVGR